MNFNRVTTERGRAVTFLVFLGMALGRSAVAGTFSSSPTNTLDAGSAAAAETAMKQALKVRQIGSNTFSIGQIEFDKSSRTVTIPGRVRLRNEVVEYALVTEQGKGYESLLTTEARPTDIHVAFLLLGVSAAPVAGAFGSRAYVPETNAVTIEVGWQTNRHAARFALAELVCLTSGKPDPTAPSLKLEKWLYNGSFFGNAGFAAQREGSIISLIRDPVALVNNPGADRDNDNIHFPNARLLPPEGTPVNILFRLPARAGG